jgi:hypothetical protein
MTQKWINVVDNGSNKVKTMSFGYEQVFRLPDEQKQSQKEVGKM